MKIREPRGVGPSHWASNVGVRSNLPDSEVCVVIEGLQSLREEVEVSDDLEGVEECVRLAGLQL